MVRFFKINILILFVLLLSNCKQNSVEKITSEAPFVWEAANVYFLLTDRFCNGNTTNDVNFDRTQKTATLRGFKGGDLQGITKKINEGYFNKLGINAIWMTPIFEQIHGSVNEGSGVTYGFHGYWMKDWTKLDPNFGTKQDLKDLVETAHEHGIRILLDAVVNHTGPVTDIDPVWEEAWVRTSPTCTYQDYESTVTCTLVKNLPDVKTESDDEVLLPKHLEEKWKTEGRFEQEKNELDTFFKETGYPRAPRFYIMKWLADYVREFGIDGYRVDTVKHTEESVWKEFKEICEAAFLDWKNDHPKVVLDDNSFFTVAEVYNFNISTATAFDFGDKKVNYYENGFNSVINFEFKYNANNSYEELFSRYSEILNTQLKGNSIMNYFSSHDDGQPFDANREKNKESAIKLLLTPGISQVYYGDESDRPLVIPNTIGDATLRSFMNWEAIEKDSSTQAKVAFWGVLGRFRRDNPAVGAGVHQMLSQSPYVFARTYKMGDYANKVIVGLELQKGEKELVVSDVFADGTILVDACSGHEVMVRNGHVVLDTDYDLVLLAIKK
ncbi:alpha-amylase family glycosyl hydrolase [Flavicella marina]|uniref:alpha-amylase family glycosyl hydrolase n=1 Tax=Flavicella marina TaxID=1475951 RepID=UPI0012657850|nr:alpha-amylase family glycosyl hydrolase [Flavicella marina]